MSTIQFEANTMPTVSTASTQPATDAYGAAQTARPATGASDSQKSASVSTPSPRPIVIEKNQLVASYDFNQELNQVIITLKRQDTGEVVKQMPPEQIVQFLQGVIEHLGILVDRTG